MSGMSIPWTQIAIAWLVVCGLLGVLFSVWFDRYGWRDPEDESGARFDGERWVPEGWRS